MTDRIPLDHLTSDQLDALYDELARARKELADHAEADSADAAAGSYAGRAERAEARLARVQRLYDSGPIGTCCAHLLRAALAHDDHAIAQPEPWLHIAFTSPDETTANTSALAIRDHLAAEFDGVSMRIISNAVEVATGCSPCTEETEPNNPAATDIETTARILAALHRSAEETVTRVTGLYEQWVKAGAPPLGTSMSRWWDRRLVELRGAIRTPAEQPARTTVKNPAALRDPIAAALYERERPPRDPHWADAYPADREVFEPMADAVLAALQPQLAALAEYENAITWHTDCLNCARVMNSAYAETVRAETAEAAVREVLDVLLPVHAGDEIIGYEPPLPIQAAAVDRWRAVLDEERPAPGVHVYLSTGCFHGDHDYCKSMTGLNGAKRPGECKKCAAKCVCSCHMAEPPPAPRDPCPHCESSSDRVPRAEMGQHIADVHPEVKGAGA